MVEWFLNINNILLLALRF